MKPQTYMTVRMCSFLLTAAVPTIGVVAAAQHIEGKRAAPPTQTTTPCQAMSYVTSNRSNAPADVLDVAPSHTPDCR